MDREKLNELVRRLDTVSREIDRISEELAKLKAGSPELDDAYETEERPAYERKRNRFCLNCGTPALHDNAIYCTNCGQKLSIPIKMP